MASGLVSVIIPTFDRPDLLQKAVASVAAQTYRPLELVIVDDFSPQPVRSPQLDGIDVRVVRHERNMGPGAARNTGLANATGEFVRFLDDDDVMLPEAVAISVAGIGSEPMHAMPSNVNTRVYVGDMRATLHHGRVPSTAQILVRRDDIVQFDPGLRVAEDVEWWVRMRDRAVFAWDPRPAVEVWEHESDRPGVDAEVRLRCRAYIVMKHGRGLDRRSRAYHLNRVASAALMAHRRGIAAAYSLRSMFARPSMLAAKLLARSLSASRASPSPE